MIRHDDVAVDLDIGTGLRDASPLVAHDLTNCAERHSSFDYRAKQIPFLISTDSDEVYATSPVVVIAQTD